MTAKKPAPEYDESIVQRLDYVPTSHAFSDRRPGTSHRWSGGFFHAGRRNPSPSHGGDEPSPPDMTVIEYDGLGSLIASPDHDAGIRTCGGCRRVLRLSAFSPKPGRTYLLRSRCDRCVERAKTKRKKDND